MIPARPWPRTLALAALLFALGTFPRSAAAGQDPAPMSLRLARQMARPSVHAWVMFRDKGLAASSARDAALERARAALPEHTLWRRSKTMHGDVVDALDLPVAAAYVERVLATGARRRQVSRWFNALSVEATPEQLREIARLPFVASLDLVGSSARSPEIPNPPGMDVTLPRRPAPVSPAPPAWPAAPPASRGPAPSGIRAAALDSTLYGYSWSQLKQHQVSTLHAHGYTGQGVMVCMLDNGFRITHRAFNSPGHPLQVAHSRDFINGDTVVANETDNENLYAQDVHGTWTLSFVGGYDPGNFLGSAFDARFLLGKTENNASETHAEEDNWLAGVEWADSLGADVISSSLAYRYFDTGQGDYSYADLDGHHAIVTRAASIAAARGIVVVNAAGNDGIAGDAYPDPQDKISAPADGESVLCVGSVDSLGGRSGFSSIGPTSDRRIKPDIMARGQGTIHADYYDDNAYTNSFTGTSFSTPIVAGGVACLLQMHPEYTPLDVLHAIRQTGDRHTRPDTLYGWGVLRAWDAGMDSVLNSSDSSGTVDLGGGKLVTLAQNRPNPFTSSTTFEYTVEPDAFLAQAPVQLGIYDVRGAEVARLVDGNVTPGTHQVSWDGRSKDGRQLPNGVYYCRVDSRGAIQTRTLVLLR